MSQPPVGTEVDNAIRRRAGLFADASTEANPRFKLMGGATRATRASTRRFAASLNDGLFLLLFSKWLINRGLPFTIGIWKGHTHALTILICFIRAPTILWSFGERWFYDADHQDTER